MSEDQITTNTKTIFMFRHGETDWNRAGRLQGGTDIPLNERGRAQALGLREFFRLNPVDLFLSSDLDRARETARIAAGDQDIPIVIEPRLRETNLGEAEGLTTEEFLERFGRELLEQWRAIERAHQNVRFPNGESKLEHLRRFIHGLEDFLHSPHAATVSRIGVATHGGSMRRLLHHLLPQLREPVMVGNCATYRLEYHVETRIWTVNPEPVLIPQEF